jgi:response regulator RpfG family c-di-GMP phosphodiesterase
MRNASYKVRKVLLIDDSIMDCMINEHILVQINFAENIVLKYTAKAGLEYLKLAVSNPIDLPDLIFLDLVMPDMDGFEFIKHFAKLDGLIHYYCPIVVLSANMDYIDYQRSMQSPYVSNYLLKPLNVAELIQVVPK